MNIIIFIILIASLFFQVSYGQETKTFSSNKELAEHYWELALEAKGGKEKLLAVENMLVSSRITTHRSIFKKKDAPYDQFYVFPSKVWIWDETDPDGSLNIQMFDMEKSLGYYLYPKSENPIRKTNEIVERVKSHFRYSQLLFLLESKWQKPTILSYRTGSIGKKKYDVIETVLAKDKHDIYLDQTSHLPYRIVHHYVGSIGEKVTDYLYQLENYQTFNGIKLPTKLYGRTLNGVPEILTYEINAEYDESIFQNIPTVEYGIGGWRKKANK